MTFVYKVFFFLATSFALMSKLNGQEAIDRQQQQQQQQEKHRLRSSIPSQDQAAADSRTNSDLWQTFEVAATDPELTDPNSVKPTLDPETLIDWYFHAADVKTKMDRQSNDLSPKYVSADNNDRPVMNFQSNMSPRKINHKIFKYDDLAQESPHQSAQHLPTNNDSQPSSYNEEALVTDYGARRTNDASMWYLRRFKSPEDSSSNIEPKESQSEPIAPSPSHHWPGSIDHNDNHQRHHHRQHRHHHNHRHHNHPNQQQQRAERQQQQLQQQYEQGQVYGHNSYTGRPSDNEVAYQLTKASSDRQYDENNVNPSSIFKEASAVSTWEEQFPISDEFNSAFNSVVAGGDPISYGKASASDSDHSRQLTKPRARGQRAPMVDSFKYDYESASGPANDDYRGASGALVNTHKTQSKAEHVRPPTVVRNMYEPPGYPPRFYRLKL